MHFITNGYERLQRPTRTNLFLKWHDVLTLAQSLQGLNVTTTHTYETVLGSHSDFLGGVKRKVIKHF